MAYTVNPAELEQVATDFATNSEELHDIIEEYATAVLADAGIAYGEGTDIDEAIKARVDQAIRAAEDGVDGLVNQQKKADDTHSRLLETENTSVGVINANLK